MGIALPQVVTSDRASGAQVIDGSLKFDGSKSTALKRTPSSDGNRKTWTWSAWVRKHKDSRSTLFSAGATSSDTGFAALEIESDEQLRYGGWNTLWKKSTEVFRDYNQFYHIVLAFDSTQVTASNRVRLYKNGTEITDLATNNSISQNTDYPINDNVIHYIGGIDGGGGENITFNDYTMTQVYLIDGQALGPESFGYADGLTNTWRPKKFIVEPEVVQTVQPTYVNSSAVLDPTNAFDGSSGTEATYSGVNSWISFNVTDASNLSVPFTIRNDSSATGQTVAMFTDSGGSSAASGFWDSTGNNTLSPAVSTTVNDAYTFPSTGTYYLRHTVGSNSNIFVYKIGGSVTTGGFGTNGFYLPMDGNSPIGEDKSGQGNNWTPVNFGGSVALDNPIVSGAKPILNTDGGGNVARPGVFGSEVGAYYAVTVASVGGGNRYHFDGVDRPNPTLTRGATYTFDQSDSSNSSHPLRFATAADAAGSTQYTDGVSSSGTPGSAGAFTRITVPHNSPSTLYYYCTNHSGMGSSTSQITDETKADPYAWKNVLALPLVGTANDVSTQILPVVNDVTRLRFKTDWNWMYVSAIEINGTILTTGTLDNSGGVWSGGDNWKNGSVGSGQETYSQSARGDWFDVTLASTLNIDTLRIYVYLDSSSGVSTNVFELELFYGNGTSYLKTFPLNTDAPNGNFNQRSWQNFGSVRFVSVRTNGDPVPSDLQSNFYGGSFDFDGTGDYLNGSNSNLNFGTGDFTIEAWCFVDSGANNKGLWQLSTTIGGLQSDNTTLSSNYEDDEFYFGSASGWRQAGRTHIDNTWHHVAEVRSGGTISIYVDGVLDQSWSDTSTYDMTYWAVGGYYSTSYLWSGYIQDFRVYKGVAKYTSNFVVASTSPDILPDTPSGVSGGSKLAKVTDGAVSFDGSGDYLLSGASSDYSLGTGNFTIEGYIYPNSASGTQGIMGIGNAVSPACQIFYNVSNSQKVRFNVTDGTAIESTGTAPAKAWSHFAVVREGTGSNETKIYINGKLEAQGTISTNLTETTLQIGRPNTSSGTEYFNGVVSNFRVLKGTALYTSNFTPPTAPLTNVTNTKLLCCQSNTSVTTASVTPSEINLYSISAYKEDTSSTNQTWDQSDSASSTSSALNHDELYWIDLGSSQTVGQVTFNVVASGQSSDTAVNYIIYYSTASNSTGSSVCNSGCTQTFIPVATGTSPGTYSVTVNFPTASSARYIAITNGNSGPGGTYVYSNVKIRPPMPAPTNFNPFNTDINTVRGQETGYATLNPLRVNEGAITLSNGNLTASRTDTSEGRVAGTMALSTGKFYFEVQRDRLSNIGNYFAVGVTSLENLATTQYGGNPTSSGGSSLEWVLTDRATAVNSSTYTNLNSTLGDVVQGDVVQVCIDMDASKIWFGKNGIFSGTPQSGSGQAFSNLSSEVTPLCYIYNTDLHWNFGQKPFKFPPPAGFQPLNAANVRPVRL